MKRRRTIEGRQSKALTQLGFGQDIPADDFSDQPDSGARIGGIRGVDEFGIVGGVASEWCGEDELGVDESVDLESILGADSEVAGGISGDDWLKFEGLDGLRALIEHRLINHDRIDSQDISVRVDPPGLVLLSGSVRSDSESMRVSEIVTSLPGVYAVRNILRVGQ
jgi:hypothetical protein